MSYFNVDHAKKIEISLDSATGFFWRYVDCFNTRQGTFLGYQDFIKESRWLHFYNLTTKAYNKFKLEQTGPDGVGYITGFYLQNLDTVILIAPYQYEIVQVNGQGKILKKIKTISSTEKGTSLMYPRAFNKIFMEGDELIIPSLPDFNLTMARYSDIEGFATVVNIKNNRVRHIIGFSPVYKDGEFWASQHILATITFNQKTKRLIVNYPIDSRIYEYSLDGKRVKYHDIPSSIVDKVILPSKTPVISTEDDIKKGHSTDIYLSVAYDPYRNMYYRFVKKGYTPEEIENLLKQKQAKPGKRSIMVIDSNFTLIKEFILEENKIIPDEFFITQEGLYVQVKSNNDDKKTFILFNPGF